MGKSNIGVLDAVVCHPDSQGRIEALISPAARRAADGWLTALSHLGTDSLGHLTSNDWSIWEHKSLSPLP